jgi:hypothetical protein
MVYLTFHKSTHISHSKKVLEEKKNQSKNDYIVSETVSFYYIKTCIVWWVGAKQFSIQKVLNVNISYGQLDMKYKPNCSVMSRIEPKY